jgi:uncharacterized protein YrrD
MKFKEGASVYTAEGEQVGEIVRVVIDPRTNEVTHLVVEKGFLFVTDRVVPIALVDKATAERVVLREDVEDLESLPRFEQAHYVPVEELEDAGRAAAGKAAAGKAAAGKTAAGKAAAGKTAAGKAAAGKTAADEAMKRRGSLYWYPPVGAAWWGAPGYLGYGHFGYPVPPYVVETERQIPEHTVPLKEGANVVSRDGEHVGDVEAVFTAPQDKWVTHLLISQGFLFEEEKLVPTTWIDEIAGDEVRLAVSSQLLDSLPEYEGAV